MGRRRILSFVSLGVLVLAGGGLGALHGSKAGAQAGVQSISAADKQEGAKAHPELVAEYGGALTGPQADYVAQVGKGIAVQSGLSNASGDFTVTLLNSPVNNAFAIPGGYVYVTRQLVGLMSDEAQLAGVLGHEVGHVAARHAAKRESAATRNTILGVLGTVISGAVFGNGTLGQLGSQVFSTGSQLLTLKYSRGQETEADNLGITYLRRAGYDPRAMSRVLNRLAAQNALDAQISGNTEGVPEWASTHPDPASRVEAALAQAGNTTQGINRRALYLSKIDGLIYGDDPQQGMVDGRSFTHPGFRMAFTAPAGFSLMNGTKAVTISGQSAKGELTTAKYSGDLGAYVRQVFAGLSTPQQLAADAVRSTTINGIPAAWATVRTTSGSSPVDITVFAYAWGPEQAFHFTAISQPGQATQLDPMFASMRRISATDAAAIKPRRIQVTAIRAGDTVQSLAKRMAFTDRPLERFLVLNGMNASSQLVPGAKVKLVVY